MSKQKDKSQYSLQLAVAAATLGMSMGISPSIVLASPDTGGEQESLQVSDPKVQQPGGVWPKIEQVQRPDTVFPKVEQVQQPEVQNIKFDNVQQPGAQFPKVEQPGKPGN